MNKLIVEELAIRAGDDWDHTLESDKEFLKKFAELIVKECLQQADKMRDALEEDEPLQALGADWVGLTISKHFGVE